MNNGLEVAIGVASFLGGAMVTVLMFMFTFVARLSRVEASIGQLNDKLDGLEKSRPTCPFHEAVSTQVAVNTQRLKALEADK